MKKILIVMSLSASLCVCGADEAPTATSLDVGSISKIVVAENPSKPLRLAVNALRSSFKKMTGKTLETANVGDLARPAFFLGREAALTSGLIDEAEIQALKSEGYLLNVSKDGVVITGADDWGTLFGVGGFLEKLGVVLGGINLSQARFPETSPTTLAAFSEKSEPVFVFRNGHNALIGDMLPEVADPHKGATPELFDRKKTGSDLWIDHTAGYLVPKLMCVEAHPEYYAMRKDGGRLSRFTDHRTPLCLSNPDAERLATERALAWIAKNPDKRFFFITYGDTSLWCQCPHCLALDPKDGEYARRLLLWVNRIAEAVEKADPSKALLTFAYGGSDAAPPDVVPRKNVWVIAATGCGNIPFWDHARKADDEMYRNGWRKLDGWLKIVDSPLLVCEYVGGSYQPAFLEQTASRYRTYQSKGVGGIAFSYGKPKNFPDLWMYLSSRLKWNPELDPMSIANNYLDAYFGATAEPLLAFFKLTREQYQKTLRDGGELVERYPKNFYSPDYLERAITCFDQAIEAARGDDKLFAKVNREKYHFLADAIRHLPSYELSEGGNPALSRLLAAMKTCAADGGTLRAFLKQMNALRKFLVKKDERYDDFLREWFVDGAGIGPEKIANGWRFPPEMFQRADFGPEVFGDRMSHPQFPCPPKVAVGAKAKGFSKRSGWTSTVAVAVFTLTEEETKQPAALELEGQDGMTRWANERQFQYKTSMRVAINGEEVFNGECGFVRGNWSRRRFEIPEGVLRAGENTLEVKNVTKQTRGPFAACWCLISDAVLEFK